MSEFAAAVAVILVDSASGIGRVLATDGGDDLQLFS